MTRWKITLEYDGSHLVGWQRQENGPSVQAHLERAAEALTGAEVLVEGAGRTDAGVHALGQVAHLDIEKPLDAKAVAQGLNHHLRAEPGGEAVVVLAAEPVPADFHARFSAVERRYRYRILNRRSPPALERGRVWWVPRPLDAEAMHDAAQSLVGHHDFTSFRASQCQAASPEKTLDRLQVSRLGEEIEIVAAARSFLHHQVRNMAGSLALVGEGKWRRRDLERALEACDRGAAGPTAPASGLYLLSVGYPG